MNKIIKRIKDWIIPIYYFIECRGLQIAGIKKIQDKYGFNLDSNFDKFKALTKKLNGIPKDKDIPNLGKFVDHFEKNKAVFKEGICWCDKVHFKKGVIAIMECTMKKGWTLGVHKHKQTETGYVLSGKAEFKYGGRTRIVTAGETVVFNSNQPHSYRSLEDTIMIMTTIPPAEGYPE